MGAVFPLALIAVLAAGAGLGVVLIAGIVPVGLIGAAGVLAVIIGFGLI